MLDHLAKRLEEEKISYYMLTGSTSKEKRAQMVENFNTCLLYTSFHVNSVMQEE